MSFITPSRSSPKNGGIRACLCPNGTYSRKCCDGSLQAQGIGSITRNTDNNENVQSLQNNQENLKNTTTNKL
jgi:hypothetical protein